MKKKLTNYILGFSLSLTPCLVYSDPVIESISYDQDNSEVLVTGSGFGGSPTVVMFDNFEFGSYFSDRYFPEGGGWFEDVLLSEDQGNVTMKAKDEEKAKIDGEKGMVQISVEFGEEYKKAFVSYSIFVPPGSTFAGASEQQTFPDVSSWKFAWLMSGEEGFRNGGGFDVVLPSHVGRGSFLLGGNDGGIDWIPEGPTWWSWSAPNNMATYIDLSSATSSGGQVDTFWSVNNDVTYAVDQESNSADNLTADSFTVDRINIPGWWGNGDNTNFDGRYDNIYVSVGDNALARIVLSDKPVLSQSQKVIVIPALYWDDSTLRIDFKAVPNDQRYYIHVFDSDDVSTREGVSICPMCPVM